MKRYYLGSLSLYNYPKSIQYIVNVGLNIYLPNASKFLIYNFLFDSFDNKRFIFLLLSHDWREEQEMLEFLNKQIQAFI